jgi:SAM-dependent methyltransferase
MKDMKENDIRNPNVHESYLKLVHADSLRFFSDDCQLETVNCPCCGSNAHDKEFEKFGFTYVSCSRCRTLFTNPRPKLQPLEKFYTIAESSRFWVDKFFKPVAEARREKIFKPRANLLRKTLDGKRNLLIGDIGAGFGLFLEELRKLLPNNKYISIEPSPEMAEICRSKGIEVLEEIIEKVDCNQYSFDVLCSFELFEHLHTPKTMLEAVYKLLKPGGELHLTTLNGEGFDILIQWKSSKAIFPPHHLNFFNPDSLKLLLESVGFKDIEITTPGVLDWDIVETGQSRNQCDLEKIWKHIINNKPERCKKELQNWITNNNLSSHMRVKCVKPME